LSFWSSRAKLPIYLFLILLDLANDEFKNSPPEIYGWAQDAPGFMDRMGFGHVRLCICPCGFMWMWHKVTLFIDTMGHV
jgi:hypothetical protein